MKRLNFFLISAVIVFVLFPHYLLWAQDDQVGVKDSTGNSATKPETIKEVTVPAGTKFSVTINSQLATNKNVTGSTFSATLANDFIFEGDTISPKGSQVIGKIVDSKSGQGLGDSKLSIQITEITVNKQLTPVVTDPITIKGGRGRKSYAEIPAGTIKEISLKEALVIK